MGNLSSNIFLLIIPNYSKYRDLLNIINKMNNNLYNKNKKFFKLKYIKFS